MIVKRRDQRPELCAMRTLSCLCPNPPMPRGWGVSCRQRGRCRQLSPRHRVVGSSFSQCLLIDELRFSFGGVLLPAARAVEDPSLCLARTWPWRLSGRAGLLKVPSTSLCAGACLMQTLPQERIVAQKAPGFCGLDFFSVTWITPLCSRASIQPTGIHWQREGVSWAMPTHDGDLKYVVKQRPVFVLIFLLYCLLLYKRLQFNINRSDSQLMWYSGRPEFLLLWQWRSAHLFCR